MGEQLTSVAWQVWLALALLVLVVLVVVAVTVRRYFLGRDGGTIECFLRERSGAWRIGCGRYETNQMDWYRVYSLQPLPAVRLPRRGLVVVGRRELEAAELRRLGEGLVVVEVGRAAEGTEDPEAATHELAMSEAALTGFLSWLEAVPPGARYQT